MVVVQIRIPGCYIYSDLCPTVLLLPVGATRRRVPLHDSTHSTNMSAKLFSKKAIGNVIVPPPQILAAWQTDAYPHGERRTWLPAAAIPLLVVSTLLTVLRLVLRLRKRGGGFGLDDVRCNELPLV
jgi:hypothetical protein